MTQQQEDDSTDPNDNSKQEEYDPTPTIYGEAYGQANVIVNGVEYDERVRKRMDEKTIETVENKIRANATDHLVEYSIFRRILKRIRDGDRFNVDSTDLEELQSDVIEDDGNDERVIEALKDDRGEEE